MCSQEQQQSPPLLFWYLRFRNLDLKPLTSNVTAEWLREISLCLYYSAWVHGSYVDIQKQVANYEATIQSAEGFSRRVIKNALLFAVLLVALFVILCWVGGNYKMLSIFLSIFWLVNFFAFLKYREILKSPIEESYRIFGDRGKIASEYRLKFVEEYFTGTWQFWRFGAGFAFLIILVTLSFYTTNELIPSLTFFCFVLFVESWMYLERFILHTSLKTARKMIKFGFNLIKIQQN